MGIKTINAYFDDQVILYTIESGRTPQSEGKRTCWALSYR
ncbi:Uncharacterised protein [[Clostridium] sordellii]|nr:Uncharacterised protein [[Clostridium] sordellii] [Paeniclostridium sordellii]CEN95171.1 Uncharacterised protein [[Clostridium] sordellii] [Paeniclostridium sordellii]CEP93285.1 Uncharacterised protein [[Clostridium] sordellii] [Paeniclostridium sordellii]